MSFTFTSLKQAVQDFTENSETSFVNNLPIFITTAEERILKAVELDFFRKNATARFAADDKYLKVPSDYLASFSLSFTDNSGVQTFLLMKDVNFIQTYTPIITEGLAHTYDVTVQSFNGGNVFYIDDIKQQELTMYEGATYRFDQSDSSNAGHPLRFSTTENGTHGGGTEYTTGVTVVGTPGVSGAYVDIDLASGASAPPTLYYYCANHSGMGGKINTPDPLTPAEPKYYAMFDAENFIIAPTPNEDYDVELHYFYRPNSITTTDDGTSWLGTNAPNTLLYGALVEAYIYMKGEPDIIQLYETRFQESIARLKNYGEGVENTDAYRTGLVRRPKT